MKLALSCLFKESCQCWDMRHQHFTEQNVTTTVKVCRKGFECVLAFGVDFSCVRACQMQLVVSAAGGINMQLWAELSFRVCGYIIFAIGIPSYTESNFM